MYAWTWRFKTQNSVLFCGTQHRYVKHNRPINCQNFCTDIHFKGVCKLNTHGNSFTWAYSMYTQVKVHCNEELKTRISYSPTLPPTHPLIKHEYNNALYSMRCTPMLGKKWYVVFTRPVSICSNVVSTLKCWVRRAAFWVTHSSTHW